MKKIATEAILRGGCLSAEDKQYILCKDDKIFLFFPIPDCVTDVYALLKITTQALTRRLLKQFKVREKVNLASSVKDSFQSSSKHSYVSSPTLQRQMSLVTVSPPLTKLLLPTTKDSQDSTNHFVDGFTDAQSSILSTTPQQ